MGHLAFLARYKSMGLFFVVASAGGSPTHPWNLAANPSVEIQIQGETVKATAATVNSDYRVARYSSMGLLKSVARYFSLGLYASVARYHDLGLYVCLARYFVLGLYRFLARYSRLVFYFAPMARCTPLGLCVELTHYGDLEFYSIVTR